MASKCIWLSALVRGDFPDLYVFPGGKVDEADYDPMLCFGIDEVTANAQLGLGAGALRYWVAVARECFEECGVLLACTGAQHLTLDAIDARQHYRHLRHELFVQQDEL